MADNEYQNLQKAIESLKDHVSGELSSIKSDISGIEEHLRHQNGRISKTEKKQEGMSKDLNQVIGRNQVKDSGMDNGFVRKLVFIIAGLVVLAVILAILSAGGNIEDVRTVL